MAIVNTNTGGAYGQGAQPTFIEALKQKMGSPSENTAIFSAESSNVHLKELKDGNFDSSSIDNALSIMADVADATFESASALHHTNNPQGNVASSIILTVSGSPAAYLKMVSNESLSMAGNVPAATSYGAEYENVYSPESFDNQVLNEFMPVSVALAYTTGQQTPGMEAIYRTVALTPEQGGIDIEVPTLFTQNPLRHADNGNPSDFGFRRLIDADIDYRILQDNVTRIIPGLNSTTAPMFVASAIAQSWTEVDGRRTVTTGALKVGKQINLFGLGSTDLVSRAGTPDYTEALDRNIGIDKVFANLGADTIAFKVKGTPFSRFVKGPEGNGKKLILSLPLSALIVNKDTVAYDGNPLAGAVFTTIANSEYSVRLSVTMTGEVDVERGVISVNPGVISVVSIKDAQGNLVDLSTDGQAIVDGLAALKVEGWTVDARLTNSNHRHLGLMLNVRSVKERLITKTRAPVFVPYPTGEDRDQTVLDWLTYTVLKTKEKDGITQLIQYHEQLMEQTGGLRGEMTPGDFEENVLPVEGVGRYLINPYVQTFDIDLSTTQSLDTNRKIANGQETLINTFRSVWFDIMQRTNYQNAAEYLDGGRLTKKFGATFLGSDTIKRFMTVAGDSRTLGAGVPFEVFSSVDMRLKDEVNDEDIMYMVITREGDGIDPLNSGVLLNTPSLVSTLMVTRDNAPRKEVVVQPRYAHYNLCPIIVKFNVKGVHALLRETLCFKTADCAKLGEDGGNGGNGSGDVDPGNEGGAGEGDSGAGEG